MAHCPWKLLKVLIDFFQQVGLTSLWQFLKSVSSSKAPVLFSLNEYTKLVLKIIDDQAYRIMYNPLQPQDTVPATLSFVLHFRKLWPIFTYISSNLTVYPTGFVRVALKNFQREATTFWIFINNNRHKVVEKTQSNILYDFPNRWHSLTYIRQFSFC